MPAVAHPRSGPPRQLLRRAMHPALSARAVLSLLSLCALGVRAGALSAPPAPLVRQVGSPVVLEFDGTEYLQYNECTPGSSDYQALERIVYDCALTCFEADGCARGCCLSFLDGAQTLFCEESGRCMRTASQTDGSSMFLTLERYEIGKFSGELNCPLGDLKIGSKSACTVRILGQPGTSSAEELSCENGLDVPNTAQLTDTDTCKLGDAGPPETRKTTMVETKKADCFPADATVLLQSGERKRMDELSAGDVIHVGGAVYSPVHMFSHKLPGGAHDFIRITTAAGAAVRLSPGHLLPVNGALSPARSVFCGDSVQLGNGRATTVRAVSLVSAPGLYNPHTLDGRIVVDGVACSAYTDAVNAGVTHAALLAPCRLAWRLFGLECAGGVLHGDSHAGIALRAAWAGISFALDRGGNRGLNIIVPTV